MERRATVKQDHAAIAGKLTSSAHCCSWPTTAPSSPDHCLQRASSSTGGWQSPPGGLQRSSLQPARLLMAASCNTAAVHATDAVSVVCKEARRALAISFHSCPATPHILIAAMQGLAARSADLQQCGPPAHSRHGCAGEIHKHIQYPHICFDLQHTVPELLPLLPHWDAMQATFSGISRCQVKAWCCSPGPCSPHLAPAGDAQGSDHRHPAAAAPHHHRLRRV
jgi:hypothetical protein